MHGIADTINAYEEEIDSALESFEEEEKLAEALQIYRAVETKLLDLDL
jgi:hypothetical protein